MKTTVTTTEAQANLPRLLREIPRRKSLTITNHGRIAGFLISKDRMEAIIETMEILANSQAMKIGWILAVAQRWVSGAFH